MTTTPPDGPPPQPDASAEARANAGARAKVLGWARRSIDLIPTSWLIAGAGAVVLAATAVFGGLEAAAVDPIPAVAVGESFSGSDLEMTVVGVELRSESGNASVSLDADRGERALVVVVDVVNTHVSPRGATSVSKKSPTVDGILIEGIDDKPSVSRSDDGAGGPVLQPNVPARLLLAWVVGPDDFQQGDDIVLTLPDSTHGVGKSVMRGDYWDDVRIGATVTTTVEEVTAP